MEVYDMPALKAFEMLMVFQIGVESFGVARAFDDERRADFAQGQQGPVDRIERDAGKNLAHLAKNGVRRGMVRGLQECLVDRRTLWSDFQTCFAAPDAKSFHTLLDPMPSPCIRFSPHGYPLTGPAGRPEQPVQDLLQLLRHTPYSRHLGGMPLIRISSFTARDGPSYPRPADAASVL
jgi:hypothetical protein